MQNMFFVLPVNMFFVLPVKESVL